MALDFYNISDSSLQQRLFELTEVDIYNLIEVLNEYRRLSGLQIDEYGTTRISQDHIELIIQLLSDYLKKARLNVSVRERLSDIITRFSQSKEGLMAVGD
ncbi:hypothetical protein [Mucilaginibacter sp. PPCGB 2223]|uniref:hypothetical protein n=1 Tax=Mucilaginibacter sp. PPCGB 2223 TaxID=1886027 RepID=UPI0015863BAF|nr:hypothetical protein [Mucilaginibacter sp. PPCGB 2223]